MTPQTSLKTFVNAEELSEAAAQLFVNTAKTAVRDRGRFTVALSGGGSPKRTYELLASSPYKDQVPWEKTFIFWGDERFVPEDDPDNNARMAREALLNQVPVSSNHLFPIPTSGQAEEAAETYAETLASFFNELPRFDLIFLGLGTNGHTASLFPHKKVLHQDKKWTGSIYLDKKDQHRITLTAPVINNARQAVFLAYGKDKAEMVWNIRHGERKPDEWPAQMIDLHDGMLFWYIDSAAAQKLGAA